MIVILLKEIKVPHVAQRILLVIKTKTETKNWEKLEKKTKLD